MKVYVTRKIPQEAISLLDPHFDISIWPEENTAVPRDVLLKEVEMPRASFPCSQKR